MSLKYNMAVDLSKMPSIPVVWLTSKLDGKNVTTFSKPELKAERILSMIILGHEDIQEAFAGVALGYMGTFDEANSPF